MIQTVEVGSEIERLRSDNRHLRAENGQLRAENGQHQATNAELTTLVRRLEKRVNGLVELGENLKAQLAEVEAKLSGKATSRNSSMPPSSDPRETEWDRKKGKGGR